MFQMFLGLNLMDEPHLLTVDPQTRLVRIELGNLPPWQRVGRKGRCHSCSFGCFRCFRHGSVPLAMLCCLCPARLVLGLHTCLFL